jgi:prepilin-type N-terminal cleavage/methylation domain-containing protein
MSRKSLLKCATASRAVPGPGSALPTGFTLLEVILSLAILAGALAALGEVMRLADHNAAMTRDETELQLIASSVMDELISGARPLTAVNQAVYDPLLEPDVAFSIAVQQTAYEELLAVNVIVEQQIDARLQPARFELVRWLPNPDFVPPQTGQSGAQP